MPVAQISPSDLQVRVKSALKDSPYYLGSEVLSSSDDGVVVLKGRVETFYHKQVAQELLRKLDGVERIVNLLEVHWGDQKPR